MRKKDELLAMEAQLADMVWYNRHRTLRDKIENHEMWLVDKYAGPNTVDRGIWEGALKAADKVEKTYGVDNLDFDDFEWGMLNGKLSAIRWMLGEEWDMLDT
jgi:hypothetical protein